MAVGSALNIALTGLKTTQSQLGVAAGNIANVDSTGYSRKVMTSSAKTSGNKVIGVDADKAAFVRTLKILGGNNNDT